MSHRGDYDDEMTRRDGLDEQAIEALLAGKAPTGRDDLGQLAGLLGVLRSTAREAVRPSAELTAILMDGISTDKGDLPVTAGSNVHEPGHQAAGLPKWRKNMIETAIAKLASLSLAAKTSLGAALAAAAVTSAGAAGVLPDPVQDAVAEVVGAVTPFELPSTADEHSEFGKRVAEDASDEQAPGVEGPDVAEEASDGRAGGDAAEEARPQDAARPEDAGAQSSQGLDVADDTPAQDHLPSKVPGSRDTADQYRPEDHPVRGRTAGPEAGEEASQSGRRTDPEAADSGRQTPDAAESGQTTGDTAADSGQTTGDTAADSGLQTAESFSSDRRP